MFKVLNINTKTAINDSFFIKIQILNAQNYNFLKKST